MAEKNNNSIEIPENADKFLFAEDLIRYVLLRNGGSVPYSAWRAGPCRKFIYNGFNETTKMAVGLLERIMSTEYCRIFHYLQNENAVDREMYTKIANDVIAKFFPAGFEVKRFLLFCVHVAILAAYFFSNGVPEALDLAVMYIVKPILDIDMMTGGWDSLNSSAQRFATLLRDSMNQLSPESVNFDEDVVEADIGSEGDRGIPEANYLVAVPGEANQHSAQNGTGSNEENGETQNNSMCDEKSDS